jgi:hypothetical protein
MKIKITKDNASKIEAALKEVNGAATSFTIRLAGEVMGYADDIEKQLEKSQLPKANRSGVIAIITPAGPSAKAYGYAAKSTTVTIQRGAKDWFLISVREASVYPRQNRRDTIKITEAQQSIIASKAVEPYTVTRESAEAVAA